MTERWKLRTRRTYRYPSFRQLTPLSAGGGDVTTWWMISVRDWSNEHDSFDFILILGLNGVFIAPWAMEAALHASVRHRSSSPQGCGAGSVEERSGTNRLLRSRARSSGPRGHLLMA